MVIEQEAPEIVDIPINMGPQHPSTHGVFRMVLVISGEKAVFRKVETGIAGATDIEILSGLNDGDQIVTGSFKVIRTLRNQARIRVDNEAAIKVAG